MLTRFDRSCLPHESAERPLLAHPVWWLTPRQLRIHAAAVRRKIVMVRGDCQRASWLTCSACSTSPASTRSSAATATRWARGRRCCLHHDASPVRARPLDRPPRKLPAAERSAAAAAGPATSSFVLENRRGQRLDAPLNSAHADWMQVKDQKLCYQNHQLGRCTLESQPRRCQLKHGLELTDGPNSTAADQANLVPFEAGV